MECRRSIAKRRNIGDLRNRFLMWYFEALWPFYFELAYFYIEHPITLNRKQKRMNYQVLLEEVKEYVLSYFRTHQDNRRVYHNLDHTKYVVKAAMQIANHYRLDDRDFFIVITASWFHDTGYFTSGTVSNHEVKGAELAVFFLQEKALDQDSIQMVKDCILATTLPQKPVTLNEQIVCDADLFHLGSDDFSTRNKLMRKETEVESSTEIDKSSFLAGTITFLESHHYHTDYCRLLLEDKKQQNLEKLKAKQHKKQPEQQIVTESSIIEEPVSKAEKKNKTDRPDRGIESMFRISSNNQQRLSDMADNKAHIMITTTSIIISVLLSLLLRKLEEYPYLTIPVVLLLAVCLITMVFSILATRPHLPAGIFTQADLQNKKVNLLFFGNFYKMNLEEYTEGMQQVMADRDFLYRTLIKDIHSQGVVLGRKYRLLRIAYNVFMFGIVASVVGFLAASIFFK